MAAEKTTPICFRVSESDRALLEAIALSQGESLSTFVRRTAVHVARSMIERDGADAIFSRAEEKQRRNAQQELDEVRRLREAINL